MADRVYNPQDPADRRRLTKLFQVKATEIEMMTDQGYNIRSGFIMRPDRNWSDSVDLTFLQDPRTTLDQKLAWRGQYGVFLSRHTFSGLYQHSQTLQYALVLYLNNEPKKKVKTGDFEIARHFIGTNEIKTFIFISRNGLHSTTANYCQNQVAGRDIRLFMDADLAFNRTKHALAPIKAARVPHRSAAEIESDGVDPIADFIRTEGLEPRKLPLMMNSDFLAKWHGAKPGDVMVMEIMGTETDTAGFYRNVHQAPSAKK